MSNSKNKNRNILSSINNNSQDTPDEYLNCTQQSQPTNNHTQVLWRDYSSTIPLIPSSSIPITPISKQYKRSFSLSSIISPSFNNSRKKPKLLPKLPPKNVLEILGITNNTLSRSKSLSMSDVSTASFSNKENIPLVLKPVPDISDSDSFSDFDDVLSMEMEAAVKLIENQHSLKSNSAKKFTRFLVLEVFINTSKEEKTLRVYNEELELESRVHLHQDWFESLVKTGMYVHIVGSFDLNQECTINNSQNFIIINPDTLISCTHVADSFECMRKSILQSRVKATNETSKAMVYGKILHELLQIGLLHNDFSYSFISQELDNITSRSIDDLYGLGVSEIQAKKDMDENIQPMRQWANQFTGKVIKEKKDSIIHHPKEKCMGVISKVLDIEEHVWSPMFGIKGNIDATVQITQRLGMSQCTILAPLEFKTGRKEALAHRAQTSLYTLLLSDRYGVDISAGILFYLKQSKMAMIPKIHDEIRGLIIGRNAMSHYIVSNNSLPPMIKNSFTCKSCYALEKCAIYHKMTENGTGESSGFSAQFEKKTSHLTQKHIDFFQKWDFLISLEEEDVNISKKELWAVTSKERQKLGRCFSGMIINHEFVPPAMSGRGINQYTYQFLRDPANLEYKELSLLDSNILESSPIVISSEEGHYALALGFVEKITPLWIIVNVDRPLHGTPHRLQGFNDNDNQNFFSAYKPFQNEHDLNNSTTIYRIDKDELSSGMGLIRDNLVSLFKVDSGNDRNRKLIVDLDPPFFASRKLQFDIGNLNCDQANAVQKVLLARDYALILGMPGTGKTHTIAQIVRALSSQGKSVLITAYTHSAVDNILLKLIEEGVDFLRLGNPLKMNPKIIQYIPNYGDNLKTVSDLELFYDSKSIVATTCLGINHVLFSKKRFDYCIIDEASQLTFPVSLGPLRFANTFVLVGDHYQLPPLVRNNEAKSKGMDTSLFKMLSEAHPEAVVSLKHQYRMNSDILQLSNNLIYNNRLVCGTHNVAEASLSIPNFIHSIKDFHSFSKPNCKYKCDQINCWIEYCLRPSSKVVFLNTDDISAPETRIGELIQNEIETQIIDQIVECSINGGVESRNIGILSPYHTQLKLIRNILGKHPGIEILTIDQSQGRDKDFIIISLVRSNLKENVGDLLRDWRRINVALTRAKHKLLIIGSKTTFCGTPMFNAMFKILELNGWIFRAPKNAHLLHAKKPTANKTHSQILK